MNDQSDRAEPSGPEMLPILALHRGQDGYVSFHKKVDDQFIDLFSVRVSDLERWFPEMAVHLTDDAFVSVNSFWRGGRGGKARSKMIPSLPGAYRQGQGLRYLNACFADLDTYRMGITPGAAIGQIIEMQDANVLPPASMLARSGRGVWAFWFLNERESDLPPRAWPDAQETWWKVQRALGERLSALAADTAARDLARVTRVPGTMHGRAGLRACYWQQYDAAGRAFSYTLDELAEAMGLDCRRSAAVARAMTDPRRRELGIRGAKALYEKRLRQFRLLWSMRGGFAEGCRNNAAVLYASFLRNCGAGEREQRDEVYRLGSECLPPLKPGECNGAIRGSIVIERMKNATISDWLGVTPGESAALGDAEAKGKGWPPASWFTAAIVKPLNQREMKDHRQHLIRLLAGDDPWAWTARGMVLHLNEEHGIKAGHVTVAADLRALRLLNAEEEQDRSTLLPLLAA